MTSSAALFTAIGVLAALRQRDRNGQSQRVDVAMFDAVVSMTDLVTNLASLGQERMPFPTPFIVDTFRASDGWFVMQLVREHQFERLASAVGHPEWVTDPRFADRVGWGEHVEDVLRPGIEAWAATLTKLEAAQALTAAGVAAGPCNSAGEVITDPHLAQHHMLVEMPRPDGGPDGEARPVLIPGNPIKLSNVAEGPEHRVPWLGEHTRDILCAELGLDDAELQALADEGVIA